MNALKVKTAPDEPEENAAKTETETETGTGSEGGARADNYSPFFITHEDLRNGTEISAEEWCRLYSADIDYNFRILMKTTKKHFPSKKINIVKAYKNFKNLCYESSSINDA